MALGAQVMHVVTYRDPLLGPHFAPFLPKTVKNGAKRGYPLVLTHFWELSASRGTPHHPQMASRMAFSSVCWPSQVLENITFGHFLEVGGTH